MLTKKRITTKATQIIKSVRQELHLDLRSVVVFEAEFSL
jgi:hypothetical protein